MNKINDQFNLISTKKSRNRIVMSPMDTTAAVDGMANDFHLQHYAARAYGGVGTIIIESTAIAKEGVITNNDLGLWKNQQIAPLKKIVHAVKKAGSVIGIQLNHAGSKSQYTGNRVGATNEYKHLDQSPLKMVNQKILIRIKQQFIDAAFRAKEAGFDFVEIHSAHGYLLCQLFHPLLNDVNKSKDICTRAAITIEIIREIKKQVNIPIGIRISSADANYEDGLVPEDMKPLLLAIQNDIDYINVSAGSAVTRERWDFTKSLLVFLPFAKKIKIMTNKPVITVLNFRTRKDVDLALKDNIDAVAIGRALLFNPSLVINTLLTPEEIDQELYTWNKNPWWNPKSYAALRQKLDKK